MDRTVTKTPPPKTTCSQDKHGRWHVILMKLNRSKGLYIFLLPAAVYFLVFNYFPMYGVQIAFKDFSPVLGITGSPWIGFDHFERFFHSYYFTRLLRNTLCLSLYSLLVSFPIPVILALAFNEIGSEKMKKTVQTISYAPHFISIVVMVGVLNLFFSQSNGLINKILVDLGMEKIPFLTSSSNFPHMYVWSGIWQNTGWNAIIYIAAISGIDQQLYEAATVDGAGRFQRMWHITVPGLIPTFCVLLLMSIANILSNGMDQYLVFENATNQNAIMVLDLYVYKLGIGKGAIPLSTVIGMVKSIVSVTLLFAANGVSKLIRGESIV